MLTHSLTTLCWLFSKQFWYIRSKYGFWSFCDGIETKHFESVSHKLNNGDDERQERERHFPLSCR